MVPFSLTCWDSFEISLKLKADMFFDFFLNFKNYLSASFRFFASFLEKESKSIKSLIL